MTDESICARCAELIRVGIRRHGTAIGRTICGIRDIDDYLQQTDTVEECSRFVEVPGEEASVHGPDPIGEVAPRRPRPRYLPHGKED